MGGTIRSYCHQNQHGWSRFLPWAEYAQNLLRQHSTSLTPFQSVLSYQPPLFSWDEETSEVPAVDLWFRESEKVWDSAHIHLHRSVRRHKTHADACSLPAPPYQPGDRVWLSMRDIHLHLPCFKLSPCFSGPFTIRMQINNVTYQLDLQPSYRITPTFHVSLLKSFTNPVTPFSPGPDEPNMPPPPPPPPEIADEDSIYRFNSVLDSWSQGSHLKYLVDWEGFGPKEQSWVPRDDILDPSLLSDFHQLHPEKPELRGRLIASSGHQGYCQENTSLVRSQHSACMITIT